MKTLVVPVNATAPEPAVVQQAVGVLRHGGLVAFPTDTLYALGADALSAVAIERVLSVKGRQRGKPLSVLVPSVDVARSLARDTSDRVWSMAAACWPGALTIVVPASVKLPAVLTGAGTVGLRLPGGPVAAAVLAAFGGPVIGTSANKAGGADPADAKTVQRAIGGLIDLLLDGGRVTLGVPSTVLDCTHEPARMLREGAVPRARLAALIPLA